MRGIVVIVAAALVAAGCTPGSATDREPTPDPTTTTIPVTTTTTVATTTTTVRSCPPVPAPAPRLLDPTDPVGLAVTLSESTFDCALEVTLAAADDPDALLTGARHAAVAGGPLLLVGEAGDRRVTRELDRLDPDLVTLVGVDGVVTDMLGDRPTRVLPPGTRALPPAIRRDRPARAWVVGADGRALWPLVWATATVAGDTAIRPEAGDLRAMARIDADALRAAAEVPVTAVGVPEDRAWQLDVVLAGRELPGGGLLLLPGRRLVALYGNPTTPVLGVLGEQGPVEGLDRLLALAAPYGADGVPILPSYEIIATVADARAGSDGDYSAEMSVEQLRPWVDTAEELGIYVILDLQPGRSDFLTQARRYEELLRRPHVGLALDPEWRLKPNQVHLRQIGTVDAAEINQVAEWLAGIVREEALPQKLLLLHQFRFSMITNRELIETPPELAVVIQMDGQGPLSTKYETWNALTPGTEDAGWWWGWKNFFDEDAPMATAAQVLDLVPVPVYVSFQ